MLSHRTTGIRNVQQTRNNTFNTSTQRTRNANNQTLFAKQHNSRDRAAMRNQHKLSIHIHPSRPAKTWHAQSSRNNQNMPEIRSYIRTKGKASERHGEPPLPKEIVITVSLSCLLLYILGNNQPGAHPCSIMGRSAVYCSSNPIVYLTFLETLHQRNHRVTLLATWIYLTCRRYAQLLHFHGTRHTDLSGIRLFSRSAFRVHCTSWNHIAS